MPGIFTVSGIIDAFIYHGHRAIKKKIEIGKFSWRKWPSMKPIQVVLLHPIKNQCMLFYVYHWDGGFVMVGWVCATILTSLQKIVLSVKRKRTWKETSWACDFVVFLNNFFLSMGALYMNQLSVITPWNSLLVLNFIKSISNPYQLEQKSRARTFFSSEGQAGTYYWFGHVNCGFVYTATYRPVKGNGTGTVTICWKKLHGNSWSLIKDNWSRGVWSCGFIGK